MKRLLDIVASLILITLLCPVMLIVAMLVKTKLGSPVLFKQQRPGLNMQPFHLWKFRTMTDARDSNGELLPDAQRLTSFGLWLRKTSLDELPQLMNVLRGEMSLIGPRPLLMKYNPYYADWEKKRFLVRPGITGLAQVSGRNYLPFQERFQLDVQYVEHWSIWLDIIILLKTIRIVLLRKDVASCASSAEPDLDVERKISG